MTAKKDKKLEMIYDMLSDTQTELYLHIGAMLSSEEAEKKRELLDAYGHMTDARDLIEKYQRRAKD